LREKARKLRDDLRAKLKPKLGPLKQPPPPPPEAAKRRAELLKKLQLISRAEDAELQKKLKADGIASEPAPTLKVVPDDVDVSPAAGDAAKARALRRQAVDQQLKSEPPRRTVRGSFSVH
jgi:hypothetical protein